MSSFLAGCQPDRESTRAGEIGSHEFLAFGDGRLEEEVLQPVAMIRNQLAFPSCVGQAFAACIDARMHAKQWASAVSIWREARRRQGLIERLDMGTRLEYAVDGLAVRGWDPYVPGEDDDIEEASEQDDLADELFADDKRDEQMTRERIQFDRALKVKRALAQGRGVVFGIGTKRPFYSLTRRDSTLVVDDLHLGGDEGGHAMRIFGYGLVGGSEVFFVQNSWGEQWGGAWVGANGFKGGCFAMAAGTLENAWDVHVIKVKV